MTGHDVVVRVSNLWKQYNGVFALRGVSFTVDRGSIVSILGPNGAGKTTLFRVLSGVSGFDRGEVFVLGYNVVDDSLLVRESIGVVTEGGMLFPELSVRENLLLAGRLRGLRGGLLENRVSYVVRLLGLEEVLGKRYGELSKGFKRRCDIAGSLLHEPELLFLDEPTAGLDLLSVYRLRRFLLYLRRRGKTVILTTHNITEAMTLSDKVIVLDKGSVRAVGPPDRVRGLVGGVKEVIASVSGSVDEFARVLGERIPGLVVEEDRVKFASSSIVRDLENLLGVARSVGVEITDLVVRDVEWEDILYRLLYEGECDPSCPLARVCMGV